MRAWTGSAGAMAWAAVVAGLAAVAGLTVAAQPLVLLVILAAAAIVALRYPLGRLLWFVLGGMFVLQSSIGISVPKLGYIAGVVVAVLVAWHRKPLARLGPAEDLFRQVFRATWLTTGFVLAWALVGYARGHSIADVARDSLTYALILPGPLLAADAVTTMTKKSVDRLLVAVTLLASVGFAVAWLSRRGASSVAVTQFVLPSPALMGLGVALGTVRGTVGRTRIGWLLLPPIAIAGQLVTGTRSGLVLLLGLFGAVGRRRRAGVAVSRLILALALAAALVAVLLPVLSANFLQPGFLQQRLALAQSAITGGFSSDNSGEIRAAAAYICQTIWHMFPWVGVGFGAQFPDPNGTQQLALYQLDTSSLYLAKFGTFGCIVLVVVLASLVRPLLRTAEAATVRGSMAVILGLLIFVAPTEDKGFALMTCLLFVLAGVAARSGADRGELVGEPQVRPGSTVESQAARRRPWLSRPA